MNSLKIWQQNVLSSGNLITVYSNGTYSTSTTTDETAASGFICFRQSSQTTSTNSKYLSSFLSKLINTCVKIRIIITFYEYLINSVQEIIFIFIKAYHLISDHNF